MRGDLNGALAARLTTAMAQELMRTAPLAVSLFDRELRFVAVNEAAATINGIPADAHPGLRLEEVIPDIAQSRGAAMRQAIDQGEALLDDEVMGETPGDSGTRHWWRVHWLPVHDAGEVIGLAALFHDVSAEARLRAQHDEVLERERTIARILQGRLLPRSLPAIPGCDVVTRYVAGGRGSSVGGDFYDLIATGPGTWLAVIGDVGGKGAHAAASTAVVRHTIRAVAAREDDPVVCLRAANAALNADDEPASCTAIVARLELHGDRMQVVTASAGHPPALLVRPDGTVRSASVPGTLLGLFADIDLRPQPTPIEPGDALVLYTDGATDVHLSDGRVLGEEELHALLARCGDAAAVTIADRVKGRAAALDARAERDDLAVMVIRRRPERGAARRDRNLE